MQEWHGDREQDKQLAPLREQFPGWRFWVGATTGSFWAMPPRGHAHRELVSAPDAKALAEKVAGIESRPES